MAIEIGRHMKAIEFFFFFAKKHLFLSSRELEGRPDIFSTHGNVFGATTFRQLAFLPNAKNLIQ
jgi:hypothetical protein